ncbi:MAG: allophanate hydrolase [Verrucomicrobiaceae bacterium]|nr:allophanate hydrolase [Verrucomicrobiaceae bacterium]
MTIAFEQIDLTIAGLRAHYARGDFTPRELVELLSERADSYVDRNIWIYRLSAEELAPYLAALDTRSPANASLYGIPFAIKDNIDLADIPTTAACAAYAYTPPISATVVENLIAAGAIPLGKTNLDQFATGLVGVRSPEPWGACRNSFNPDYISGGSSSGSAVAVALGLASFSIGTDTAGSGRIPAAFNNIVGWKPTRGLLSIRGVVPACKSIDCASVFATTAADINSVFSVAVTFDDNDPFSRHNPAHNSAGAFGSIAAGAFKFGVPRAEQLEFFGDATSAHAFEAAIALLESIGGIKTEIDFSPFLAAARLLYEGPWIAERYWAIKPLLESNPSALLPVTAKIISAGRDKTAADTFDAMYQMQVLRRIAEKTLRDIEFVVTPTAGTIFTQQQLIEEPILCNSQLGYYTNFMNLLDLSAIAVPTAMLSSGLPFGITLFADRFTDLNLLSYAQRIQQATQLTLGATSKILPAITLNARQDVAKVRVVVCGAHMSGLPFNPQLLVRRATLIEATTTSAAYRFYALPGGVVKRPGLIRDEKGGAKIAVEVWEMPAEEFGSFVALIPKPLGIGKVELINGKWLSGFLCESYALEGAEDITARGDWRAYIANSR